MRVLLATLLSLLVGTAAGQCDTAGYTQCLAEHLSSANPNKCATAGFTGDAMCACQAQSAVCAKRFKCPEMCETTMTALSCGAAWCKVSNVSKPIRFTTVYRFTKEITNSQLWSLIVKNLSPAINTNWVSITDVVDTSVQTPSPTLPNDITRDDVNKGCPKLNFASDCEGAMTFGLCRWTGTACVPSGKKLPSEAPVPAPRPVPVPAPGGDDDVRGLVCKQLGDLAMAQCSGNGACVVSGGKCVPDPNGQPIPADFYCQSMSSGGQSNCVHAGFGLCRWTGSSCEKGTPSTSPAENKDVRPAMCEAAQAMCSALAAYCVEQGGKCVPDPNKSPITAGLICPQMSDEMSCTSYFISSSCSWSGGACVPKSTARVAAVLAGGPWEATVKVEIKKEDSASPDVYMNDALVAQLPNQMDTMATTGDFKSYGATVEQSTVSEKANEGTAGGGGSDGMSTGAIIGIVAGCLVGIALVGVVGFMVVKRKDTANMNSPSLVGDYQDMQKATGPNDYANMQTI
eukprot:TRINITY_DN787_c0_g2_i14.p1 TRINITY_DN787_c0_g2~~TRINITY_DN787_c0_g2_i14.p1  ORF type:complete len:521 (+),score=157.01 TRINITY_DN787_c0_g2_i14:23-1564(+)